MWIPLLIQLLLLLAPITATAVSGYTPAAYYYCSCWYYYYYYCCCSYYYYYYYYSYYCYYCCCWSDFIQRVVSMGSSTEPSW